MNDTVDNRSSGRVLTAVLEHLTGPARGTSTWLGGSALDVALGANRLIRVSEPGRDGDAERIIARLHASDDSYEIEARGASALWVNGERVSVRKLEQGDLIEFGETGPLSRLSLIRERTPVQKSVESLFGDCVDYLRVSRKPLLARMGCALRDLLWGLTRRTTVLFRSTMIAAIVALGAFTAWQIHRTARLQELVEKDTVRLESFAIALTRAREEALSPGDLKALRQDLEGRLTAAHDRLQVLEERSGAGARVIASATRSIVFLQGGYGFRDTQTKRMLRHVVDEAGQMLLTPRGQPLLTLEGEGPVAERKLTGTAFVVSESGILVTNRHVALPWEDDASVSALGERGLEPVWIRFIGYLPDSKTSFPVELLAASEDSDLAILRSSGVAAPVPHLTLVDTSPEPGDEVIVMGYPTGLRSMVAQTGNRFVAELEEAGNVDFWAVAARLAAAGYIRPLASGGIVGQVTPATVVYDAETTHGGSGGPVLDMAGKVVAVNTAVIPEYGGSNLGVPADKVKPLLASVGAK